MECPYCRTENHPAATKCAACASWIVDPPPAREWTRAREGKIVGGVCRGLARHFRLPVAAVRLVFLLFLLFGGWGVLAYVGLWIAMPLEPATPPALPEFRPPGPQPPAERPGTP